jgi:hypothetical protein
MRTDIQTRGRLVSTSTGRRQPDPRHTDAPNGSLAMSWAVWGADARYGVGLMVPLIGLMWTRTTFAFLSTDDGKTKPRRDRSREGPSNALKRAARGAPGPRFCTLMRSSPTALTALGLPWRGCSARRIVEALR